VNRYGRTETTYKKQNDEKELYEQYKMKGKQIKDEKEEENKEKKK